MGGIEKWLSTSLLFLYVAIAIMILEGFRFRLRLWWYPAVILATLAANLYALSAMGLQRYVQIYPLTAFLPLLLTTFVTSRYRGFKTLFIFLTATIWISPLLLVAHFAALVLYPAPFLKFICYILLAVPMLLLLKFYFRSPLIYLLDNYHRGWALFCAVPLLCSFVTFYQTRYRFMYDLVSFQETGIWQLSLSLLSFLTYLLIVQYARQIRERLEAGSTYQLLQTQHQGALQHIETLKQSQQQAALYVHDLRHHLRYIHSLALEGNHNGIMTYVSGIEQSINELTPQDFCKNETLNLILSYFSAQAKRKGVSLEIQADIPDKLDIPDADLCVIISNALENAIKAAETVRGQPRVISFHHYMKNGQLFLEITNPFTGEVHVEDSSVRSGQSNSGLGTRSIALIVEKHAGLLSFEAQNGIFTLRLIL